MDNNLDDNLDNDDLNNNDLYNNNDLNNLNEDSGLKVDMIELYYDCSFDNISLGRDSDCCNYVKNKYV